MSGRGGGEGLPSKVFLDVRLGTWNRERVLAKDLKAKPRKNTDDLNLN